MPSAPNSLPDWRPVQLAGRSVVLVRGNGSRTNAAFPAADLVIGFNQARLPADTSLVAIASTGREPVEGTHFLRFEATSKHLDPALNALVLNAKRRLVQQTKQLGCIPSTGFMVAHALWGRHAEVWVDGMNFDPTLVRPPDLPTRKPLPQMFHNWLGERRVTLSRWLGSPPHDWNWSLTREHDALCDDRMEERGAIKHAEILEALLAAQRSGSMARLEPMVVFPVRPSRGLLGDAPETLLLEGCFHLHRHLNETPNWWLYDQGASVIINRLAQRLRSAQRQTFRMAKLRAMPAD